VGILLGGNETSEDENKNCGLTSLFRFPQEWPRDSGDCKTKKKKSAVCGSKRDDRDWGWTDRRIVLLLDEGTKLGDIN
jgi:hypothetical protein